MLFKLSCWWALIANISLRFGYGWSFFEAPPIFLLKSHPNLIFAGMLGSCLLFWIYRRRAVQLRNFQRGRHWEEGADVSAEHAYRFDEWFKQRHSEFIALPEAPKPESNPERPFIFQP